MCRFPGFLSMLGVCVAVIAAIAIGVAPATDDNAVSAQPVQVVVRAERPALTLLSAQLFTNASRDVAVRGHAKTAISSLTTDEPLLTHRVKQPSKRALPELAMIGDGDEHGPPFRR